MITRLIFPNLPMQTQALQITKWPFYTANAVLNLAAVLLVLSVPSFSVWVAFLFVLCAGLGAVLLAAPFLMEYRARVQAHAQDARSRANVNEERFEEWASNLKEQTEYLAQLTEQIENNMFATEGLVRRADRKLDALEKFESKMDQIIGETRSSGNSSSTFQESTFRSTENEPLFARAQISNNENELDLSIFNDDVEVESDIDGDGAGDASNAASKVVFQEQSDYACSFHSSTGAFDNRNQGHNVSVARNDDFDSIETANECGEDNELSDEREEDPSCPFSLSGHEQSSDSSVLSNDPFSASADALDVEYASAEEEVVPVVAVDPEPAATSKVRVSTKSSGRRKKSAAAESKEIPLFPEDVSRENASNDSSKEDESDLELKLNFDKEGSESASEDNSAANEAPESAYKVQSSGSGSTAVIANVMIGLGNKPFIRGEGGDLSWEKGLPMEFLEIGKWGFTFEKPSKNMSFRIFKNDKEADAYVYKMKSGQVLEVEPKFIAKNLSLV